MARINGANSDYAFDSDAGTVVEDKSAHPLYMKIFICPYEKPSSLENLNGEPRPCEGSDDSCPNVGAQAGHASVTLHQVDGITLQTDGGTVIRITQDGIIDINGLQIIKEGNAHILRLGQEAEGGPSIELQTSGDINLVPGSGGSVKVNNTNLEDLYAPVSS